MKKLRFIILPIIVGLLLGYMVKKDYIQYYSLTSESIMDLNIVRNLYKGDGLTLSIKETYTPKTPLVRTSVGERGVLYPLLMSLIYGRTQHLQLVNFFLSVINSILLFFIIQKVFGSRPAWLTFFIFILNPRISLSSVFLWNFQLVLFFLLLCCMILIYGKSIATVGVAGAMLGFTFWTDPWFLFSALAFLPGLVFSDESKKTGLKKAGSFLAGFLVVCLPLILLIYKIHDSLLPVHIAPYFQVKSYSDFLKNSYAIELPGVMPFIGENAGWIMKKFFKNLGYYLHVTFIDKGAWFLLMGLLGVYFASKQALKKFPRSYLPLLSFSLVFLCGAAILWSKVANVREPVYIALFIVPVLFYFLCPLEYKKIPVGLLASVLLIIPMCNFYVKESRKNVMKTIIRLHYSTNALPENKAEDWFFNNPVPDAVILARNPWKMYMITQNNCGLIPVNTPPDKFREFCREFGYNYFVNNSRSRIDSKLLNRIEYSDYPWMKLITKELWKITLPPEE